MILAKGTLSRFQRHRNPFGLSFVTIKRHTFLSCTFFLSCSRNEKNFQVQKSKTQNPHYKHDSLLIVEVENFGIVSIFTYLFLACDIDGFYSKGEKNYLYNNIECFSHSLLSMWGKVQVHLLKFFSWIFFYWFNGLNLVSSSVCFLSLHAVTF